MPPSSDPWAESWTQEDAEAMLRAATGDDAPAQDRSAPSAEPTETPGADMPPEPVWREPEPAATQVDDRAEAHAEPPPDRGPRVEPWSPDPDPWRFEPEPEPDPAAASPQPEPASEAEPIARAEEPAPVAARWPSRTEEMPDWLAEPAPAPLAPAEAEERPADDAVAEDEPAAVPDSLVEAAEPEAEGETEADGEVEPQAGGERVGSFWDSILPWRSAARAEAEPDGLAEMPDEHPQTSASSEAEPAIEPRWPASVPEREWTAEPAGEGDDTSPDEPPGETPDFVPIGGGLTYATPADAEPASRPEPEPELESQPGRQPEPDPLADAEWRDAGDSTQVLPAGWAATTPEPRTGELEPSAGPVRTRLAEPDADLEGEAAPTIAEQAVPWLIGVILLLAGMVIVLLALIFAGDGSLGGGASGASPSPALAVVPPGASASATPAETPDTPETPEATTSEEPSPTPRPTTSPEAIPEYGPLEMVYQGRSAALAPIYLLRHDFTVDGDPTVLAQDASHDVRRFAWAPDGRVGAGLLVDVLVSIEPGQEKRRLGDGLMTITFGDDASTVYAVRITEDGTTDTATVLAIDFVSGDTQELASVSYERPQPGNEAALAEARFSDEGGPVRLYWMANDMLRLWVLGAGAWTVDPAGGDPTELDGEPLPTLLAPNGRERITAEAAEGVTTLTRLDMNDRPLSSTTIEGMVSHLRWSPAGDRVVFTLGRSAAGGGVLQDLFLWDLGDEAPMQLTSTGAAFGAEWLGTQPRWAE